MVSNSARPADSVPENFEFERKYLVTGSGWRERVSAEKFITQGYLAITPLSTTRVRISENQLGAASAVFTVKGELEELGRPEYEYEIPVADARQMLSRFAESKVTKRRFALDASGADWTVDVFLGGSEGLVLLEVEADVAFSQLDSPPAWVGDDVTDDPRFYNAYLSKNPFQTWSR